MQSFEINAVDLGVLYWMQSSGSCSPCMSMGIGKRKFQIQRAMQEYNQTGKSSASKIDDKPKGIHLSLVALTMLHKFKRYCGTAHGQQRELKCLRHCSFHHL